LELSDILARSPICKPYPPPARSPGVHLSGVLRYIASTIRLKGIWESVLEDEYPLRMAIGVMWEEFCASLYPDSVWWPDEIQRDGVYMTCDGQCVIEKPRVAEGMALEECKATSQKRRRGDEFLRDWLRMHQGQGYCMGYQTNLVRWHMLYLQGDYNGSGPQYIRYLVAFTAEEIRKTWNMVLQNRDRAEPES
jgi:hypothetical protein